MHKLHQKLIANKSIVGTVYRMLDSMAQLDVPVYAANAAYFIIMAALPTILLVLGLLRYTPLNSGVLIDAISAFVPEALMPLITRLVNSLYESSSTILVSVSALTAVWSASRGVYGIVRGLNRVYDVRENRSYFYTRFMSVIYMVVFIVMLILSLSIHVLGQLLSDQIPGNNWFFQLLRKILPNRFLLLFFLQTLAFTGIFMAMPNRRNRFLASVPGAVLASFGWLVFTDLFSLYVDKFSNYPSIYGSLSIVALAMLWLYICIEILFFGGALNKYLMDTGHVLRLGRKKDKRENKQA